MQFQTCNLTKKKIIIKTRPRSGMDGVANRNDVQPNIVLYALTESSAEYIHARLRSLHQFHLLIKEMFADTAAPSATPTPSSSRRGSRRKSGRQPNTRPSDPTITPSAISGPISTPVPIPPAIPTPSFTPESSPLSASLNTPRESQDSIALSYEQQGKPRLSDVSDVTKSQVQPPPSLYKFGEPRTILLEKGDGGFGFQIVELQDRNNKPMTLVASVEPGKAAALEGSLQRKDRLLKVNGEDVSNASHDSVRASIQKAQGKVILVVAAGKKLRAQPKGSVKTPKSNLASTDEGERRVAMTGMANLQTSHSDTNIEEISLSKDKDGLGIYIVHLPHHGLYIHEMSSDGAARRDGRLRIGDKLMKIGSQELEYTTHAQAMHLVSKSPNELTLRVKHQSSSDWEHLKGSFDNYDSLASIAQSVHQHQTQTQGSNSLSQSLPPLPPGSPLSFKLIRTPDKGFGMVVAGGINNSSKHTKRSAKRLYVKESKPNSVAEKAGVRTGDFIKGIDDEDLDDATHAHVIHTLKTKTELTVHIHRPITSSTALSNNVAKPTSTFAPQESPASVDVADMDGISIIEIIIEKSSGSFGLMLGGSNDSDGQPIYVRKIRKGSPGEKLGLRKGDVIASLNGVNVVGSNVKDALDLMSACDNLEMVLVRGLAGGAVFNARLEKGEGRLGILVVGGEGTPFYVKNLQPEGIAAKAGLMIGDIVVAINNEICSHWEQHGVTKTLQQSDVVDLCCIRPALKKSKEDPWNMISVLAKAPSEYFEAIERINRAVKTFCSGTKPEKEYSKLGQFPYPHDFRLSKSAAPLNRYNDIAATNDTRVSVPQRDGNHWGYINANHIELDTFGFRTHYIMTQGPLANTVADFWAMVFANQASLIVMVTSEVEKNRRKCHRYWPAMVGDVASAGEIQVEFLALQDRGHTEHSKLKVVKNGQILEVDHIRFKNWPDHGVPAKPDSFIGFVELASALQGANTTPIVIHCSAGVGRSGVFAGTFYMRRQLLRLARLNSAELQHIQKDLKHMNIYEMVRDMRSRRNKFIVQTQDQYLFLYFMAVALIEHIQEAAPKVAPTPDYDTVESATEGNTARRANSSPTSRESPDSPGLPKTSDSNESVVDKPSLQNDDANEAEMPEFPDLPLPPLPVQTEYEQTLQLTPVQEDAQESSTDPTINLEVLGESTTDDALPLTPSELLISARQSQPLVTVMEESTTDDVNPFMSTEDQVLTSPTPAKQTPSEDEDDDML
eukprot:m.48017 g.48017  ORF g.48017 m.48017 type:complete len:1238 (-) comp10545_c0_seq1:17-3730(-)